MLSRIVNRLPDNLLVAQVDTIEKTNGKADLAAARAQFGGGVNEFHGEVVKWVKWFKQVK